MRGGDAATCLIERAALSVRERTSFGSSRQNLRPSLWLRDGRQDCLTSGVPICHGWIRVPDHLWVDRKLRIIMLQSDLASCGRRRWIDLFKIGSQVGPCTLNER